ncbi:PIN domain-containing protein [Nocardia sp. XZ_19_385]|uniref:PIN domain-containing protein n=1 Tax=Nocardia sp. XZ_19_385 TaxID=2769488 RepID=UPI00188E1679|nr:PIN domain-containing protein [Nocardia sp. XZ_19_385]
MILYLDASAIITKVTKRRHVHALNNYIEENRTARLATNAIGFVESVLRSDRYGDYPNLISELSVEYARISVSDSICDLAMYMPRGLKAADAIHVASAMQLGRELLALVTYDEQMANFAHQQGLPVAMPGARP